MKAAAMEIVDRILRLSLNEQVAGCLPELDLGSLQAKAQDALRALALSDGSDIEEALPPLCALASECVAVVEHGELGTGLARLVSAGCELLGAILSPQPREPREPAFSWVHEALEDVSDQFDRLALEIHRGLGRLDGAVMESDALPVVLDPLLDDFGSYWGSIEHRQALQELSAWLLCVVFRALGYSAVSARSLMDFANHDVLCLCALLRGLLSLRPSDPGPEDAAQLQALALAALCGLASPELAFGAAGPPAAAEGIEEQTRALWLHREALSAALVETGLLERGLACARGTAVAARFLGLLATCIDAGLRDRLMLCADRLGSLLETLLASPMAPEELRAVVVSCARLTSALGCAREFADDGFTLACRALLAQTLPDSRGSVLNAALAALACNVGDLEMSSAQLAHRIAAMTAEERRQALEWLRRPDNRQLCSDAVLSLFEPGLTSVVPQGPPRTPEKPTGLRDVLQHAPPQFRCALDGKLLCDPVVTPQGLVCERSTLLRCLQNSRTCPVHGVALRIEDCSRSPQIRRDITEWVRGQSLRNRKTNS